MSKISTLVAALLAVVTVASPAVADNPGWSDGDNRYGYVEVSADRKHITVCDSYADSTSVYAEYATTYLLKHTMKDEKGGDRKCGEDSVFFGTITVFKICFQTNHVSRHCKNSVWIKR
ncbi:hypothetical protein [Microbispora sp. H10885]|uniref:hypothetical protein n=1 Tax=Microbispora sp. H10885 TaxID=2729110 RepID=UPI001600092F|nr:hypothetical protein [Microbispora sp. H10885]